MTLAARNPTPPSIRLPDGPRRADGPRRVRAGVRLAPLVEGRVRGWVGAAWLRLLDGLRDEIRAEGLDYAEAGQTVSMHVEAGAIEALVQGRRKEPYVLSVSVPRLSGDEWRRLVEAMSRRAVFAARLPEGELPAELRDVLRACGVTLVPESIDELSFTCECRDRAEGGPGPCKHAAAVMHLLGDRFDVEPVEVLRLRGMTAGAVIERLRQRRSVQTHGIVTAHPEPACATAGKAAPDLSDCLRTFWRGGEVESQPESPVDRPASHALLRRLGPSPLRGRFPIAGLLASVYDVVAEEAERTRDRAEAQDRPPSEETPPSDDT